MVRALASHQCVPGRARSRTRRHMWVEFVVGSLLCSERFFSGYSTLLKNQHFQFQFDLDYCQALYHEPLARVIAQSLPVFDIKFAITSCRFATVCNLYCPSLPNIHSCYSKPMGTRNIMFLNYLQDHCENNTLLIMKFAVCVEERPLVFVKFTKSFAFL